MVMRDFKGKSQALSSVHATHFFVLCCVCFCSFLHPFEEKNKIRARQSLTICCFKNWCKSSQAYGFLCPPRTWLFVSWPWCLAVKNYLFFFSNSFGMELLSESERQNKHWSLSHSIWGCQIGEAWSLLDLPQRKIQNNPSLKLTLSSYLWCLSHVCSIKSPLLKEGWIVPFMHYVGMHM